MKQIVTIDQAIQEAALLHKQHKRVVLVGGCFDLLHVGHITFLEKAKAAGDVLVVLLESDAAIRKTKGNDRPINNQHDRAVVLSCLCMVDYVIPLPDSFVNYQYDKLVIDLKPAIIATTRGDASRHHKERQAAQIGAQVIDVIDQIRNQSTTRLVSLLNEV